jgi:ABC-2 type transport system permease protein
MTGQVLEMARRSLLQTLRQPAMVVPPLIFPLLLVAINTGGLDAATNLPGFPADTYLDFAIAVPFVQGALFAMINAGSALARDVETGFLKRLAMTPMQRAALLLGHLAGVLAVALVSALIYLAVVGLRSGSGEAVQGFFPLFFVLLFLSSMSLPRPLIEQDWFRAIATANPVSYLIEGIRSFMVVGWDGEALALGFGIAVVVAAGAITAAATALRTRLVRT